MEQTQSISSNPVNFPFRFLLLFHLLFVAPSTNPGLCSMLLHGFYLLRNCLLTWNFSVSFIRYLSSSEARRLKSEISSTPCEFHLQAANLFPSRFPLEISNPDHAISISNTCEQLCCETNPNLKLSFYVRK
jgi:hypothetical protein